MIQSRTAKALQSWRLRETPDVDLGEEVRQALALVLPDYLLRQRSFAGKARGLRSLDIEAMIELPRDDDETPAWIGVTAVEFETGRPDRYCVPLTLLQGDAAQRMLRQHPRTVLCRLNGDSGSQPRFVCEATHHSAFWTRLYELFDHSRPIGADDATLLPRPTRAFDSLRPAPGVRPKVHGGEQSNTSAFFDGRMILKLFRRLPVGVNPDLEMGRFLTEKTKLSQVAHVGGSLDYTDAHDESATLAVVQEFKPNEGDAWSWTLRELLTFCQRIAHESPPPVPSADLGSLLREASQAAATSSPPVLNDFLTRITLLGTRTAQLHLALGAPSQDPAFAPEPMIPSDLDRLAEGIERDARKALHLLRDRLDKLPPELKGAARRALTIDVEQVHSALRWDGETFDACRIRCHGDYHLGQVLFTGDDFVIIDFEGEPDRPLAERRRKDNPLRDVAGMLRSFDYAPAALLMGPMRGVEDPPRLSQWLNVCKFATSSAFLRGYLAAIRKGGLVPDDPRQLETLLRAYVMQKAFYELSYELNNRPAWVGIPLHAILDLEQT